MKLFLLVNKHAADLSAIALAEDRVTIISAIVAAPDAESATSQHPGESEWGSYRDCEAVWPGAQSDIEVIELGDYIGPTHEDACDPVTISSIYVEGMSRTLRYSTPAMESPSVFAA